MEKSKQKREVSAYDKALSLLSIRPHSKNELSMKLRRKGYSIKQSEEAIDQLLEQGLINDEITAAFYLEGLMRRKAYGYFYALSKMMAKGFEKGLVEELMSRMFTVEEEKKLARKFADSSGKKGDKLMQALQRRGFRTEATFSVIEN